MLEFLRGRLQRVLLVSDAPPEVPEGTHPEVFRASPRFLRLLLIERGLMSVTMLLSVGLPAAGAVVVLAHEGKHLWLAALIGVAAVVGLGLHAAVSFLGIKLDFDHRWYVLTDRALRIREGIWTVREVTLTLANVQDIKVSQGPIQRLLGLQDVVVDTAGGGGAPSPERGGMGTHQGLLRGVATDSALVDKIRARVQQRKGTGLGDVDEAASLDVDAAFVAALAAVRDEARLLAQAAQR